MKILKINKDNPDKSHIKKATKTLKSGGIIVYPTDTAYAIGVNALKVNDVRKMYEVKGRNFSKPTHVVCTNWHEIKSIALTNKHARLLFKNFMPGPLTLILNKKPLIPDVLTANLPTVGVRIPDSKVTKGLSSCVKFPYTTSSANVSGGQTPYSINEVEKQLNMTKIDVVLDAGKLNKTPVSTIIDLTKEEPKILRDGPIIKADIETVLGLTF